MASNSSSIEHRSSLSIGDVPDESSPLLPVDTSIQTSITRLFASEEIAEDGINEVRQNGSAAATISLLLIGVFISNADGSLVIATAPTISSHFSKLEFASWILTSYALSTAAAQPVIAKLSDVFGRKIVLLICYVLFAIGNMITGVGREFWQVVAGRTVAGLGGAGMNVLVSILITDLVPKIEVASWRSYVNVVATVARSIGGPLGGWLADTIGWRLKYPLTRTFRSFIGQAPMSLFAFLIVTWKLVNPTTSSPIAEESPKIRSKLGRIDYIGSILMSATIVTFILAADMPSRGISWTDPIVVSLLVSSAILGITFVSFEQKYAREPIFPPRLLVERNVASSYAILALQMAAQVAMMFSVPLYFQITSDASIAEAGSHLVPAVIGNAVGGLMAGFVIKRTGKYKRLLWLAGLSACAAYAILIFTWHGSSSLLASLSIFPSGFGTGIAAATTFVVLTVYLPQNEIAVATGGLYLMASVGMILGLSLGSSLQRGMLRSILATRGVKPKIIQNVLDDVSYIRGLKTELKEHIIQSYVESLEYSHGFSLICSALTLLVSYAVWEEDLV